MKKATVVLVLKKIQQNY